MGETLRKPVPSWWMMVASFMSAIAVGAMGLGVAVYVRAALCETIAATAAVYRAEPPATPTGIAAADSWQHLERRFFC